MSLWYLLALGLSLAQGHWFLRCVWPSDLKAPAERLLHASLSVGIGLGLSSLTYFSWRLLGQKSGWGCLAVDAALVLLLGLVAWRLRGRALLPSLPSHQGRPLGWLVDGTFAVGLVTSVASFAASAVANPHGEWDAWAIWNMRARFLFRGQEHWADAFSPILAWSHPDYPLLVPSAVARLWTYGGHESHWAPVLVDFLFSYGAVGLLVSTVWLLRGRMQGMLAGVVLLATAAFTGHGASQYADVPLAYGFLAAVALVSLAIASAPRAMTSFLALAGTMAGFAAWTKNEGLLFLMAFGMAVAVLTLVTPSLRTVKTHLAALLAGLMVVLPFIAYFKVALAPPNDLMSPAGGPSTLAKLLDPARHRLILAAYESQFKTFGQGAPGILIGLLVLAGLHRDPKTFRVVLVPVLTLVFLLVGYYGVYLITPHDVAWHLATSLGRLVIQVWPLAVLATFLSLRLQPPSEASDPAPMPARSPAALASGTADGL